MNEGQKEDQKLNSIPNYSLSEPEEREVGNIGWDEDPMMHKQKRTVYSDDKHGYEGHKTFNKYLLRTYYAPTLT